MPACHVYLGRLCLSLTCSWNSCAAADVFLECLCLPVTCSGDGCACFSRILLMFLSTAHVFMECLCLLIMCAFVICACRLRGVGMFGEPNPIGRSLCDTLRCVDTCLSVGPRHKPGTTFLLTTYRCRHGILASVSSGTGPHGESVVPRRQR